MIESQLKKKFISILIIQIVGATKKSTFLRLENLFLKKVILEKVQTTKVSSRKKMCHTMTHYYVTLCVLVAPNRNFE